MNVLLPKLSSCHLMSLFLSQRKDATYRDYFSGMPLPPSALYTHKYSPSLSRLLLAGGPLPLGLYGNYCAVWT